MSVKCSLVGHQFYVEPIYQNAVICQRCEHRWSLDGYEMAVINGRWDRVGERLRGRHLGQLAGFWCERAINRNRRLTDEQKDSLRKLSRQNPGSFLSQVVGPT